MSRMSEGGAVSAIDAHLFPGDLPDTWSAQSTSVEIMEHWISHGSLDAVESPSMSSRPIVSERHDKPQSVDLRPTLSQMSFPISSGRSDNTDQSFSLPDTALNPSSPHYTDSQTYSESTYLNDVDSPLRNGSIHTLSTNGASRRPSNLMPVSTGSSFIPLMTSPEEVMFTSPMDLMSQNIFEPNISQDRVSLSMDPLRDSEWSWDAGNDQTDSRVSSPFSLDVSWPTTAGTNNSMDYSPTLAGRSPRTNRKAMAPQNSPIPRDPSASYRQHSSEASGLHDAVPSADRGHGSIEIDNTPREHPLYQKAVTGPDGLYHCPWEDQEPPCNHKPEKLKCNYDKFVDSHLKPYRCKVHACENARFSSTACLLRHEREAHAMHGHGEKPFLCTFEGCERGTPGNGFPRHWNLCDHMKRVHNRSPSPPTGVKVPQRSRKRKNDTSETGTSKKSPATTSSANEKPPASGRAPSLNKQFQQSQQQLLSELQQFKDLGDITATTQTLHKLEHHLKMMKDAAQRMNSTHKLEQTSSQLSG